MLPEARKGRKNAKPVDKWPWIFKDLKRHGFVTMFSEDSPYEASFNYRLLGFEEPPADHYGRPFWFAARLTTYGCVHSQPQAFMQYTYLKSLFDNYPDVPKFALLMMAELAHRNLNTLGKGEDEFLKFLKVLREGDYLNDTMLVVMSDHGLRYGESRMTFQGKFERRGASSSISHSPNMV